MAMFTPLSFDYGTGTLCNGTLPFN
jgi:hypothetical protein